MQIQRLLDYLENLSTETQILQWHTQNDTNLSARYGKRINLEVELFIPANVVLGTVEEVQLESGALPPSG